MLLKKLPTLLLLAAVFILLPGIHVRAQRIIIRHAVLVDVANGKLIKGQEVVIEGNSIAAVLPQRQSNANNARIIDAKGLYLMPGLWDHHMHFGGGDSLVEENQNLLPLFVAHGITAVRDASADLSLQVLRWRDQVKRGSLPGPRIFTSGPKLEGINSMWIGDLEVGTVEDMQKGMDSLQKLGVDFVKITDNTIRPEVYLAAIREARKRGLRISGHIPQVLTMQQVSDAGLSSVEHMSYMLKAGASNEADIAAALSSGKITAREVMPAALQSFDEAYARQVYQRMAKNGTAIVPTLSISRVTAYLDQENHWNDDYLQYIGQGLRNTYLWRVQRAANDNAEAIAMRHRIFEKAASLLPLIRDAGVSIIAGTDAGYLNSFDYPGIGLHTELELLVKYGLTPAQALQASIINGPKYFGLEKRYGRIAKGYAADLVLLGANPLENISHTQQLQGVMLQGQWLDRKALDDMLQAVKQKAAASAFKKVY